MRRQQHNFQASELGREWTKKRENLPVFQVRDQLLATLTSGHMAVLSGDTGCGKTTQVPQYLLQREIEDGRGSTCSIVCTQPRRIAAMSVADRVAQERAEPPPGKRGSRIGCASSHVTLCCFGCVLFLSLCTVQSGKKHSHDVVFVVFYIPVELYLFWCRCATRMFVESLRLCLLLSLRPYSLFQALRFVNGSIGLLVCCSSECIAWIYVFSVGVQRLHHVETLFSCVGDSFRLCCCATKVYLQVSCQA